MLQSWNNYPKLKNMTESNFFWLGQQGLFDDNSILAYGNGRSYGDVCLNENGKIIKTQYLNHFIGFDENSGILRCESGVLLADILQTFIPRGWILPVVPGTQFVTIGGAIANDVHGKNHYLAGSFGCHVLKFGLLRSDQKIIICSPEENTELFTATIGGLGLTGIILWADVKLTKITNTFLDVETIPFYSINEFFEISNKSHQYEFTVAWLDCQAKKNNFGRGLFMRANWKKEATNTVSKSIKYSSLTVPYYFPNFILNKFSIGLFNDFIFARGKNKSIESVNYQKFFFPLDNLLEWNKIYGRRGFFQYQCVVPLDNAPAVISELLKTITSSGQGSFLSVLKVMGPKQSSGMLSFPMEGVTFALDFPNHGKTTLALLMALDAIVIAARGRVYPAKDARMSAEAFKIYYPNWVTFQNYIDPKFSSSFWRRVMHNG